ncbi:MAG: ABC transporter substrate-binding protein [Alphaproteobacteria bacterium]
MKSSVRAWVGSMTLAAGLVAASAAWAQDKAPIKIGLIDIYSGGLAFIAEMIKGGFQVALDDANAAGGMDGRMFELETADMGFKVEKAVTEARRMILEQDIKLLSVGIHSGAAVAVSAIAKEQGALMIGGFAVTKRLTGESGHDLVGRANLSTVELGAIMAEYLRDKPEIKRVSTIAPDYEYGQHFVADFIVGLKKIRPDIEVVRQEWPKLGAADFASHVTALQAQPIDMVVAGVFGGDLINFVKAASDFGLFEDAALFVHGSDIGKMASMKDILPKNTHTTLWYPFYSIDTPESNSFKAAVEKLVGTYPSGSAPVGYIAGRMIVEAVKKAGTDDPAAVAKALKGLTFPTPVGPAEVRGCDHMAMYNFYVGKVAWGDELPGGIGVPDAKAVNFKTVARPCEEIAKLRGN